MITISRLKALIAKNTKELQLFLKENPNSELFEKIAQASINYHYFTRKELYPFRHFGKNNLSEFKKLPAIFYEFREEHRL